VNATSGSAGPVSLPSYREPPVVVQAPTTSFVKLEFESYHQAYDHLGPALFEVQLLGESDRIIPVNSVDESSALTEDHSGARVIDGDLGTPRYWTPHHGSSDHWLRLNLAQPSRVKEIRIHQYRAAYCLANCKSGSPRQRRGSPRSIDVKLSGNRTITKRNLPDVDEIRIRLD